MRNKNGTNRKRIALLRFSYLIPILTVVSILNAGIASVGLEASDGQPAPTETATPTPTESATPDPAATETATPDPAPTETTSPDPAPTDPATSPPTDPTPTTEPTTSETSPPDPAPPTQTAAENPTFQPTISSDKPDYFAGETVTLTGSGWLSAESVQIVVNDDAGESWRRDVVVSADISGGVVDSFTLPDWFVATYSVRATGLTSGAVATTSFTDTGGAYNIDLAAADPGDTPTYAKQSPAQFGPCPAPSGGAGIASDPMANAIFGSPKDAVESLAPEDMILGQIVPFELEIRVSGSTAPENGRIKIVTDHATKTTNGGNFGFDPAFQIYCAFIDTNDSANVALDGNEKVESFSSTIISPGTSNEEIRGTYILNGLDNGDTAVLEVWVVLKSTIVAGVTGNVQSELVDADTCTNAGCTTGQNINTGNQTVPLLRVQEFFSADADLSITKTDDPDPVVQGAQLTYTISVTNNGPATANSVVVTDTLDPNTTYVSSSLGAACSESAGVVTCNVGGLTLGQSTSFTITVNVSGSGPTAGSVQTGNCAVGDPGVDLCNVVSVDAINNDPVSGNNSDSEPTNVLGNAAIDVEKEVSTDGGTTFVDADSAPGPTVNEGDSVQFRFTVTNTGGVPLTNVTLSDSDFTIDSSDCTQSLPVASLAPGGSFVCTITETLSSVGQHTDTATAQGTFGSSTVSDTDDANVTISDVLPDITVTKTANDSSVPESGQNVTFTFVVTNNSSEAATITELSDSDFGTLTGDADCQLGTVLAPSGSAGDSCSFQQTVFIAGDFSGDDHVNTFTAKVTDGDGNTDTATDDETVVFEDVLPDITISKTADPTSVPEGGMTNVKFTIVVTNNSLEDATIDSLSDTVFDLSTLCPDAVGTVLGSGESYTCEFTIAMSGNVGDDHENTATVVASDNEGNTDTAMDSASVTITNVAPAITVTKDASPTTVDANSGGGNVTFTVTVTNDSVQTDPVTITAVTDELWYDVNGDGNEDPGEVTTIDITNPSDPNLVNTTCNTLIGTVIQPGDTESCTFTVHIDGNPWEDPINTVTVDVEDDEETPASGSDTATVDIVDQRQPSIAVSGLTASRSADQKTVSGRFRITNEADDPIEVLVRTVNVTFEQRSGKKWTPISSGTCSFWLDDGDGVRDPGDTMIDPANAGVIIGPFGSVTILYSCTRTTAWPNQLRITAHVTIHGRPGVVFRFTGTFTF